MNDRPDGEAAAQKTLLAQSGVDVRVVVGNGCTRSCSGKPQGFPWRTAPASSRQSAVTNLRKQRGLSPVDGNIQDDSDAVITPATSRSSHWTARLLGSIS
jgi:hypothetical protein